MVDPLLSLALNLHAHKGAYALLIGSGVSRGAEIPTGWEIVSDLIKKLSKLSKDDCGENPIEWYGKKFKAEPNYSKLLKEIAPTKIERNKLLRAYFEPSEEEKEEGKKLPTKAHRAIAELVSRGYIKVIITTNFDRLVENALEEKGIVPNVIYNDDSAKGALPLTHASCVVIKVHGDYLDSRIKNTPTELSRYGNEMNLLLDRIFDEYGLITCGWSGEWDEALRDAMSRCKGRRFTYYFTKREALSLPLQTIIKEKDGKVIDIVSADIFFDDMNEKLLSLAEVEMAHPLSAQLAVATVKRYLSDKKYRIKLHDLITKETESVYAEFTSPDFSAKGKSFVPDDFRDRIKKYQSISKILRSMLSTVAYWGDDSHKDLLKRSLERIANVNRGDGLIIYNNLKLYPALLILYSAGIGAFASGNYGILKALLSDSNITENRVRDHAIYTLYFHGFIDHDIANKHLFGTEMNYHKPMSEHLHSILREELKDLLPSETEYNNAFDIFEYLFALVHGHLREKSIKSEEHKEWWGPVGMFGYKLKSLFGKEDNLISDFCNSIEVAGNDSPVLKSGLFDSSIERFKEVKAGMDEYISSKSYF